MFNMQSAAASQAQLLMQMPFLLQDMRIQQDPSQRQSQPQEEQDSVQQQTPQNTGQFQNPMMHPMAAMYNPMMMPLLTQQQMMYMMSPLAQMSQLQNWFAAQNMMKQATLQRPQAKDIPVQESKSESIKAPPRVQQVEAKVVSLNETKVKINLKQLKAFENKRSQQQKKQEEKGAHHQNWDLRKRLKKDEDAQSDAAVTKIKLQQRPPILNNYSHQMSTRRTLVTDQQPQQPKIQSVLLKNDGVISISTKHQADLSAIAQDQFPVQAMKRKLSLQKVWNGGKDLETYQEILDLSQANVSSNITHYDVLVIINHYKHNLPLLVKKLREADPIIAYDINQLKLSFKCNKKQLKKNSNI